MARRGVRNALSGMSPKVNKQAMYVYTTFLVHQMASRSVFRRLLSGAAAAGTRAPSAAVAAPELQAIKVDDRGRVWRVGVRVGSGELLKHLRKS